MRASTRLLAGVLVRVRVLRDFGERPDPHFARNGGGLRAAVQDGRTEAELDSVGGARKSCRCRGLRRSRAASESGPFTRRAGTLSAQPAWWLPVRNPPTNILRRGGGPSSPPRPCRQGLRSTAAPPPTGARPEQTCRVRPCRVADAITRDPSVRATSRRPACAKRRRAWPLSCPACGSARGRCRRAVPTEPRCWLPGSAIRSRGSPDR